MQANKQLDKYTNGNLIISKFLSRMKLDEILRNFSFYASYEIKLAKKLMKKIILKYAA